MSAPFTRLDRLAAASVEAVFAERVRWQPMLPGKYSAGASDPARPALEFQALVTVDQGFQRSDGERGGDKFGVTMTGAEIRISIAADLFPPGCPRKSDHLIALDRPCQPVFEIVRLAPDNASRITLHCVAVKPQDMPP